MHASVSLTCWIPAPAIISNAELTNASNNKQRGTEYGTHGHQLPVHSCAVNSHHNFTCSAASLIRSVAIRAVAIRAGANENSLSIAIRAVGTRAVAV
jgi:hypothetical protein